MTSSSTCRVSAVAVVMPALSCTVAEADKLSAFRRQKKRGLLNSSWHRPSLFLCQPWPLDQVFYSGYCSGSAALVCESTCGSQGLKSTNWSGPALVLCSDRLTHSTDGWKGQQGCLLAENANNGFEKVFPDLRFPRVRQKSRVLSKYLWASGAT